MDFFSQAIAEMHLASSLLCEAALGPDCAIDFEQGPGSPAHAVIEGEAVLIHGGRAVALVPGDIVLFPRWQPHAIATAPGAAPHTIRDLVRAQNQPVWVPGTLIDRPVRIDLAEGPAACRTISMIFQLFNAERNALVSSLPECVILTDPDPATRALLRFMAAFVQESRTGDRFGYPIVSNRLAELVFTQIVKEQVRRDPSGLSGFLRGLADPALGRVLPALHADPGRRWSLAAMAEGSGLCRTRFCQRFVAVMGQTPHAYLTDLRMERARALLTDGASVKAAAHASGYRTTAAFGRAYAQRHGRARRGATGS